MPSNASGGRASESKTILMLTRHLILETIRRWRKGVIAAKSEERQENMPGYLNM